MSASKIEAKPVDSGELSIKFRYAEQTNVDKAYSLLATVAKNKDAQLQVMISFALANADTQNFHVPLLSG